MPSGTNQGRFSLGSVFRIFSRTSGQRGDMSSPGMTGTGTIEQRRQRDMLPPPEPPPPTKETEQCFVPFI